MADAANGRVGGPDQYRGEPGQLSSGGGDLGEVLGFNRDNLTQQAKRFSRSDGREHFEHQGYIITLEGSTEFSGISPSTTMT